MPMVYSNNGHSFGNKDDNYVLQAGEVILQEGATPAQILAAFPRYNDPVPATSVLSQDLMAQFTVTDYTAIRAAIAGSDPFGLLWSSMQAQKDPMIITNARFMAGWNALIQILGQPRMTQIATALNVTIV
jgi:hypothetical protein